jgi:hypothetical protein
VTWRRVVFVLGGIWSLVLLTLQVFKGGSIRSIVSTVDAQGVVHESPCAHDPTCGDVWWHPWAAWLIGLVVIFVVVRVYYGATHPR